MTSHMSPPIHSSRLLHFLLIILFGHAHAWGQDGISGQTHECRWTEAPPVIDGRDDDPGWKRATVVENFRQAWAPGEPAARQRTRVRLLWDREAFYFLAELDDTEVTALVKEHDGRLWENDVFEIFLKPSEKHAGYYEFEANPFGAVLDAFFPGPATLRADRDVLKRGEFHLEVKVQVRGTLNVAGDRDTGWTVEGRIPWTDLNSTGGRPAPGETWRVNLARIDGAAPGHELSSVAPLTRPSFHRTAEYAMLRFAGPSLSRVTDGRIRRSSAAPTVRKASAPFEPGQAFRPAPWSRSCRRPRANGCGMSSRRAAAEDGCACDVARCGAMGAMPRR